MAGLSKAVNFTELALYWEVLWF